MFDAFQDIDSEKIAYNWTITLHKPSKSEDFQR